MEYGSIEREIHVDASPEVVFEVVSRPEHIREWWSDEADIEPRPGAVGELVFGERGAEGSGVVSMTVVEVDPPRSFSFRWTNPAEEVAAPGNSLLVTFELVAAGAGTLVRMTEVGFREMGWEAAVLEEQYRSHCEGWDHFVPRLGRHASELAATR